MHHVGPNVSKFVLGQRFVTIQEYFARNNVALLVAHAVTDHVE